MCFVVLKKVLGDKRVKVIVLSVCAKKVDAEGTIGVSALLDKVDDRVEYAIQEAEYIW